MSKTVITIAMTDGAHADEVATETAKLLGYRYVNDEILDRAAEQAGVDAKAVAAVEHSESLVGRIMRSLSTFPMDMGGYGGSVALEVDQTPTYRSLIQEVVRSVAAEGKVVVGAHAAGMTLAGTPGLLRVFVTAPVTTRISRVAAERNVSKSEAEKEVHHTDRERKGYIDRFFHTTELPTHYDLVINTEVLTPTASAALIASAASAD